VNLREKSLSMTTTEETPRVALELRRESVAVPAHAAAIQCQEVVDLYFGALASADLSKPPSPITTSTSIRHNIAGISIDATERRLRHESWILARAFQDLLRGVRESLERAYLLLEIAWKPHRVKSGSTLAEFIAPFKRRASDLNFPDLLKHVNESLTEPLNFSDAYRSLQNARNCLEHRGGIVGARDVDESGTMRLMFPYVRIFYERRGEEVEVETGIPVNAEDGSDEVMLLMRISLRERSFKLNERLKITATDFNEIAFSAFLFGSELMGKLPSGPREEKA
jgi:hypothetical protein